MYHTSDFNFELPTDLIASHPLEKRDASRMLVVKEGDIQDMHIRDIISFIQPGDVIVFNNSRVVPVRFMADGHEITLHTCLNARNWWGLCKKYSKIKRGSVLTLEDGTTAEVIRNNEKGILLHFNCEDVIAVLEKVGKLPLPPYMKREEEIEDRERYQTVYADPLGSMAAPTAGLHFTDELIKDIEKAGAQVVKITLHVGAGTWMPVKTENLEEHQMHSEWCCITPEQAEIINNAKRVIAVGTTSMRTLESAHQLMLQKKAKYKEPLLRAGVRRSDWAFEQGKKMSFPFNTDLIDAVRKAREENTLAQELLWRQVRRRKINDLVFLRKRIIGDYIVDFLCEELGVILEIDGDSFEYDEKREAFFKSLGLEIIHIPEKAILEQPEKVAEWLKTVPAVVETDNDNQFASLRSKIKFPRVMPMCRKTSIFITPGYKFGAVDVLLTNFHLPKSTLFMLVSAFSGLDEMKAAYKHAIDKKYRFFSYGDCCLLFKRDV